MASLLAVARWEAQWVVVRVGLSRSCLRMRLRALPCAPRSVCSFATYNKPMSDDSINQSKFDAILKRLINSPPLTMKEAVAKPRLKKNGKPKKVKTAKRDIHYLENETPTKGMSALRFTCCQNESPVLPRSSDDPVPRCPMKRKGRGRVLHTEFKVREVKRHVGTRRMRQTFFVFLFDFTRCQRPVPNRNSAHRLRAQKCAELVSAQIA